MKAYQDKREKHLLKYYQQYNSIHNYPDISEVIAVRRVSK